MTQPCAAFGHGSSKVQLAYIINLTHLLITPQSQGKFESQIQKVAYHERSMPLAPSPGLVGKTIRLIGFFLHFLVKFTKKGAISAFAS